MMRSFGIGLTILAIASIACQSPLQISSPATAPQTEAPAAATVVLVNEVVGPTATPIPSPTPPPTATTETNNTPTLIQPSQPTTNTVATPTVALIAGTVPLTTSDIATPQNPAYLVDSVTDENNIIIQGYVTGIWVNLRNGPSTDFDIVGKVYERDELKLIGRTEDSSWWQVCCDENGEAGWMTNEFIRTEDGSDQVAVTYRVPEADPVAETSTEPAEATTAETEASDNVSQEAVTADDASNTESVVATEPALATAAGDPLPVGSPAGFVDADLVNLRAGPNTDTDILGRVPQDTIVDVIGRNADNSWWKVCCVPDSETEAWIINDFIKLNFSLDDVPDTVQVINESGETEALANNTDGEPAEATLQNATAPVEGETSAGPPLPDDRPAGFIDADVVNLRAGPGTNYDTVGRIRQDTVIDIIGRNADSSWWKICCVPDTDTEAWIINDFVKLNFTLDEAPDLVDVVEEPEAAAPVARRAAPAADTAPQAIAAPTNNSSDLPPLGNYRAPGGTNPLTGLPLPSGRQAQRPVIVCINNDTAARPQFGTSQADVMYEYLMEGFSITRFSGIFYGEEVGQIGPVRSARLVNYYMAALFDAPLLCSGASDGVRFILKNQSPFPYLDIDLDDPSNKNYSSSVGTDYRTRVRTSSAGFRSWLANWGEERPAAVRGFTFGGLAGGGVPATGINIPYPSVTGSNVEYRYDGGSGRYLRFLNGNPHTDGNTGAQLALDNVIVQYVAHGATDIVEDSLGSTSIRLNLFRGNRAILFRDGVAFSGTWQSSNRGDMPHFFNEGGQEVPLKPGKTWISIVPPSYEIGF